MTTSIPFSFATTVHEVDSTDACTCIAMVLSMITCSEVNSLVVCTARACLRLVHVFVLKGGIVRTPAVSGVDRSKAQLPCTTQVDSDFTDDGGKPVAWKGPRTGKVIRSIHAGGCFSFFFSLPFAVMMLHFYMYKVYFIGNDLKHVFHLCRPRFINFLQSAAELCHPFWYWQ